MLKKGDTVAFVACSNGMRSDFKFDLDKLINLLKSLDLNVKLSPLLFKQENIFNGSAFEKAKALESMFIDKEVKVIFDISGGDLCNELLSYLDFNVISNNSKLFCGYSDLSVLLNALYTNCRINTYYYQIRNLLYGYGEEQLEDFKATFMENNLSLFDFDKSWIKGNSLKGIVVGGNLRCTLKLAGTKHMPNFKDKILFLESLGGDVGRVYTSLIHYKDLGAFDDLNGIILGNFTEMENHNYSPTVIELLERVLPNSNIPIIKSSNLGHGKNSKSIKIGEYIELEK